MTIDPAAINHVAINHVFVYGTLLPGDVRFHLMAPFVVDEGWPDAIAGRLFDTGMDYPAAVVDGRVDPGGRIIGRTFALIEETAARALDVLDEVEGVVEGAYRRVPVTTASGIRAWVYEFGDGPALTPIRSRRLAGTPATRASASTAAARLTAPGPSLGPPRQAARLAEGYSRQFAHRGTACPRVAGGAATARGGRDGREAEGPSRIVSPPHPRRPPSRIVSPPAGGGEDSARQPG